MVAPVRDYVRRIISCLQEESNLYHRVRNPGLYPLSHGDVVPRSRVELDSPDLQSGAWTTQAVKALKNCSCPDQESSLGLQGVGLPRCRYAIGTIIVIKVSPRRRPQSEFDRRSHTPRDVKTITTQSTVVRSVRILPAGGYRRQRYHRITDRASRVSHR